MKNNYFLDKPFDTLWPDSKYNYDLATHPTVQCAKALQAYNQGEDATQYVNWIIKNLNPVTGGLEVHFDWNVRGYSAKAPWINCMTQGMALSVLSRIGDTEILRLACRPFWFTKSEGGLILGYPHDTWYDGIPSPKGTQILNETMFGLIGLYEASIALDDRNIYQAFRTGLDTVERHLHTFDLVLPFFKWSRYDNGSYFYSGRKYHQIQIQQLQWLYLKTDSRICLRHSIKWDLWQSKYQGSISEFLFTKTWFVYNRMQKNLYELKRRNKYAKRLQNSKP